MRTVDALFSGVSGHASGDVTADGRATAADVTGTLLGLINPTEDGPYGSGFLRLTVTKPSETVPGLDRVLRSSVWYPAAPGTFPTDSRPGGRSGVPLADGASNLPVILFSHGSCGFEQQSIFLVRRLATWGFVVAAPPHPGNTTSDFNTCSTPAEIQDSFANRPADIIFLFDQLLELNEDPESPLFGAIDPLRVGVAGHSFGGLTALRVLSRDPRFRAGLALAPVTNSIRSEVQTILQPVMIQVGQLDGLLNDGRNGYELLPGVRALVELERTTHSPFSDFCLECTSSTTTAAETHLYSLRFAIPFLLHHVAGDRRFDDFLAPAATPPGAVYLGNRPAP
jgi:predicted dienelactone hydrolase